ncbi:PEP-CTERM/exosortase system-associated acyltransferase [Ectothiorhodospira shaposhnikovii]|uniref:PEP-CTERM/exosortase system-associated acyltransferase n=1 Tax=Ectothiorhodospira shaposhnikovii TaxID=1054 RepID=UPI001903DE59|nr:PEP-CTERM/exosortase system-associated acyltransferase [Ectothiorhodospira shaposhnikovii]MBK1672848.1 hypothetical protein [Ectothiorhodospira shaposhnikovii]
MKTPSLVEHFASYFQVLLADTEALKDEAHKVRYDVYCREFAYEKEEDCPGGRERDEYDAFALHCIIRHRACDVPAGCIRVVIPPAEQPGFLLPMEAFCRDSLTHSELKPEAFTRDRIGEVSRLAVHTQFRRRRGESDSPAGYPGWDEMSEEERRTFPLLGLALFCAGTSLMQMAGREYAFVMMERRLARMLQSSGFPFVRIGEPMEYHGTRAAYYVRVEQVIHSMQGDIPGLHNYVHESLMNGARGGSLPVL